MAGHTKEHLDKVLNALEYLGREADVIGSAVKEKIAATIE
jgi:hypothetical protein